MKTYIPTWIDKYSYIIITTLLRQYPAVCAELEKMKYMVSSPNEVRKKNLMWKRSVIENILDEFDNIEYDAISECFFKNKKIADANVPMSESSIKRLNKKVILTLGRNIGEIN